MSIILTVNCVHSYNLLLYYHSILNYLTSIQFEDLIALFLNLLMPSIFTFLFFSSLIYYYSNHFFVSIHSSFVALFFLNSIIHYFYSLNFSITWLIIAILSYSIFQVTSSFFQFLKSYLFFNDLISESFNYYSFFIWLIIILRILILFKNFYLFNS
jgi:hypothetical protein